MTRDCIPVLDLRALLADGSGRPAQLEREILAAAADPGFFLATGLEGLIPIDARTRSRLLGVFQLPPEALHALWRHKFAPSNPNVYRGWFPVQPGFLTSKEGMDIGPDVAYGSQALAPGDPLREPTPLPPEDLLPGWRSCVREYYLAMERVSRALMQAIAHGLGLAPNRFDPAFPAAGLSTLRLIRYPAREDLEIVATRHPEVWVEENGRRRYVTGVAHVDSGFLTLLAQDGVEGLQARTRAGAWVDVPAREGTLAVNFGKVLERWTGGRICATEHRVLGSGCERRSIPFFYEAAADAVIEPLPGDPPFAPFLYGDHLWASTTRFVEFAGLQSLRPPRGPPATAVQPAQGA